MSNKYMIMDAKLESLEKWRCSELDTAQVVHARKQAAAAEREKAVDVVQQNIEASHELSRAQTTANSVISVECLTRIGQFTTVQVRELQRAQDSLQQSKSEVADAHALVVKSYEERTVVERLRKRRAVQAEKETRRREQRLADDQALMRLAGTDNEKR